MSLQARCTKNVFDLETGHLLCLEGKVYYITEQETDLFLVNESNRPQKIKSESNDSLDTFFAEHFSFIDRSKELIPVSTKETMNDVDVTICPKCGTEDTHTLNDWLGFETRQCENEACGISYELTYQTILSKVRIVKPRQSKEESELK